MPNVSASTLIFGALIMAFLIFITVKGELPKYLAVMGLGTGSQS